MRRNDRPLHLPRALCCILVLWATGIFAMTTQTTVSDARRAQITLVRDSSERIFAISTADSMQLALEPAALCEARQSGWSQGSFVRWFRIADNAPDTIRITCSAPLPLLSPSPAPSVQGSYIRLPSRKPLARKAAATLPKPPFRSGLRIETDKEGIYRISGATLRSHGVPLASIASRHLRLWNRGREIPLAITNPWHATLADDDAIMFHAEELRADSLTWYTQYSSLNAYWLSWDGTVPGARMSDARGSRSGTIASESGIVTAESRRDTLHIEQDNDIRWIGDVATPAEPVDAPGAETQLDNWYWGIAGSKQLSDFTFLLPSPDRAIENGVYLTVKLMGLTALANNTLDHRYSVYLNNASTGTEASWDGQTPYTYVSARIPASQLNRGLNTLSLYRIANDSIPDRVALDWIEIDYLRSFDALDNSLDFQTTSQGENRKVRYRLTGFTSPDIELWDLRNSRRFSVFTFDSSVTGSYAIIFQDSSGMPAAYHAEQIGARVPFAMTLDSISDLGHLPARPDWLAVVPDTWMAELAPLIALREKQGLRCAAVSFEQLCNRYTAGIKDPAAIRDWVRELCDASPDHPPSYLLLAGDASHDLYKQRRELTFVPTALSHTPGWGPSSNDDWFVTVKGADNFPDLSVGRLPVRSRDELRASVARIVRYENNFEHGPWHDRLLALGGFEAEFQAFNDRLQNFTVKRALSVSRLDATPASRWFTPSATAAAAIADQINTGVYAINFCGHGGGNTWSDNHFFGMNDLSRLHNGRWPGGGRLPHVFSFTCLTGFFESAFYSSLGEELVRLPVDGAISFYGASAYTKRSIDMRLSEYLLRCATQEAPGTIGQLIAQSENAMLATEGSDALTLSRQYNLLGDPALSWELAPQSIASAPLALRRSDSIPLTTVLPEALASGSAKIELFDGNERLAQTVVPLSGDTLRHAFAIKSRAIAEGCVRVFAWNDSVEARGVLSFSRDTIALSDIAISPTLPGVGDTVRISCSYLSTDTTTPLTLVCQYALDDPAAGDPDFADLDIVPLQYDAASRRYIAVRAIRLAAPEQGLSPADHLMLQFRSTTGLSSNYAVFPLAGHPDLAFSSEGLSLRWTGDSLALAGSLINRGAASSGGIGLLLCDSLGDTLKNAAGPAGLASGEAWDFTLALPDFRGAERFSITAIDASGRETATFDNSASRSVRAGYHDLRTTADTAASAGGGMAVALAAALKKSIRLFIVDDTLAAPAGAIHPAGEINASFFAVSRPASSAALAWVFRADSSIIPAPANSVRSLILCSRGGEALVLSADSLRRCAKGITTLRGPLFVRSSADRTAPAIRLLCDGKALTFTDYAPKDRPFTLQLSDSAGIDTAATLILLNGEPFPADRRSAAVLSDNGRGVVITLYPQRSLEVDTITTQTRDRNGNSGTASFSYRAGQDLSIRFLSCHPNPFGARSGRMVRFAYLLTDEANDVTLAIYTISGRRIWSTNIQSGQVGYQEIQWNGLDTQGHRLANGTYYAKLSVKNAEHTVTKIMRIAKLEGYNK